jgi:hypothetical protein
VEEGNAKQQTSSLTLIRYDIKEKSSTPENLPLFYHCIQSSSPLQTSEWYLHSIFKLQPRSRNIPTGFSLRRVPDLVPHQEELNVSWSNAKLLGSPVELPK